MVDDTVKEMRRICWGRAKGEIRDILQSYCEDLSSKELDKLDSLSEKFINKFESKAFKE